MGKFNEEGNKVSRKLKEVALFPWQLLPIGDSFTRCGPSATGCRKNISIYWSMPTSVIIDAYARCTSLRDRSCVSGPLCSCIVNTILHTISLDMAHRKTYVVEHLDPECGPWSTLEYITISQESAEAEAQFCLSSAPKDIDLPDALRTCPALSIERRSVEDIYRDDKSRVCLLDPAAKEELSPDDRHDFDVFVFGGILGTGETESICIEASMTNLQAKDRGRPA